MSPTPQRVPNLPQRRDASTARPRGRRLLGRRRGEAALGLARRPSLDVRIELFPHLRDVALDNVPGVRRETRMLDEEEDVVPGETVDARLPRLARHSDACVAVPRPPITRFGHNTLPKLRAL